MTKKPTYEELEQRIKELEEETFDRKKAEEALRESEEKFRALAENQHDVVWTVNENLEVDYISPSCFRMTGTTVEETMGMNPKEFYTEESYQRVMMKLAEERQKSANEIQPGVLEVDQYHKDGHLFPVEITCTPIIIDNKFIGVQGITRDITERKKAEEEIRKLSIAVEQSPSVIAITDLNGDLEYVNPKFTELTGYTSEEAISENPRILKSGEQADEMYKELWETISSGKIWRGEFHNKKKNGELFWEAASVSPICDKQGKITGYIKVAENISERKLAEEALRESEEKYRTILESIEDGYYEVDIAGKLTFFNDSLCKILGYSKDELMGMNNRQYTDKETAKKVYQIFNKVYTTGIPEKGFHWPIIRRKDGMKVAVEASASLIRNVKDEPIGFRGIVRDISEKRRLEAQLQQASKMEAIATLAGGVAHEFNNALMGVMGNIELLKMNFPEDAGGDKYFEAMKDSGHRMSRLTDQLLAYSQGGKYQPRDLKLDDFVVIETLPILQHDITPTVRVETHFPKDISYISADYAQMQMVLSAILANSNEAIEDEGLIRITAENKDLDEDFAKQHPGLKPGPYVCLTIEDDGKGMDEETKTGIFEPFFTTKFQGRGMGMAAVYGIVKNHDGWISVDSELGKGTTVRIYLPAISAGSKEQEAKAGEQPEIELAIGEGTILMIEDEDVVIEVTQTMLEMLGYRVMVAKTGKDAIHITETFDGQIDLALLDIKLPDMEGGKVYPLIMKARPDLKVIVFSGYSIEGPARKILDAGAQDFIQKPFSLATLSEKLKEVLEGK